MTRLAPLLPSRTILIAGCVSSARGNSTCCDEQSLPFLGCRDGGIDAVVDHAAGSMSSKEVVDIYSTDEPQAALHARVAFCLDIHNEVSVVPDVRRDRIVIA